MELEMTGSAITIHLETYISRQAKKLHFKAGQHFTLQVSKTFLIPRQANIIITK